jgi:hypothetical protein
MQIYRIVEGRGSQSLEESVNQYIKWGWKPLGGVAFSASVYVQAMVKTIKKEKQ